MNDTNDISERFIVLLNRINSAGTINKIVKHFCKSKLLLVGKLCVIFIKGYSGVAVLFQELVGIGNFSRTMRPYTHTLWWRELHLPVPDHLDSSTNWMPTWCTTSNWHLGADTKERHKNYTRWNPSFIKFVDSEQWIVAHAFTVWGMSSVFIIVSIPCQPIGNLNRFTMFYFIKKIAY